MRERLRFRVLAGTVGACLLAAAALALLPGFAPVEAQPTRTPPPTPVPPFGSPSPFQTELHTPGPSLLPPDVDAPAAILLDPDTGQILLARNADERRPVASLTKVMSALVVLERVHVRPLRRLVTVSANAASQPGSGLDLVAGEQVEVGDLLAGMLMASANDAAVALAEDIAGTEEAFAELMNQKAEELGLADTHFEGATGLDDGGYSTARDMATLFAAAWARPEFQFADGALFWEVPSTGGPPRQVQNRNVLLWLYPGTNGGKTGFTTPAGHCLVASATSLGHSLVVVVLGAGEPAFDAGATLLNYGFGTFVRLPLLQAGQGVGVVEVPGGTIHAIVDDAVVWLVRVDMIGEVERRFVPAPSLELPVEAGDVVGTVTVLVAGDAVATVDAEAAPVPRTPGLTPGPSVTPPRPVSPGPVGDFWGPVRVLLRAAASAFL